MRDVRTHVRWTVMTRIVLLLIAGQAAVFAVLGEQAYSLKSEIASLQARIAVTKAGQQLAATDDPCLKAVWPNIPGHCLQRVSSRRSWHY